MAVERYSLEQKDFYLHLRHILLHKKYPNHNIYYHRDLPKIKFNL